MKTFTSFAALVALSCARTVNIPARNGNVQVDKNGPIVITGPRDFGNQEFERGVAYPVGSQVCMTALYQARYSTLAGAQGKLTTSSRCQVREL